MTDVDTRSFKANIKSWAGRGFRSARCGWLVFPAEEEGKCVHAGTVRVLRSEVKSSSKIVYQQAYERMPATFVALQ